MYQQQNILKTFLTASKHNKCLGKRCANHYTDTIGKTKKYLGKQICTIHWKIIF